MQLYLTEVHTCITSVICVRYQKTINYKNGWSLPFMTLLDHVQKMFNIFQKQGEELSENTKVRELLKWVQHNQLQYTLKALHVCLDLDSITYTKAAFHLTSIIFEMAEYQLAHHVSTTTAAQLCSGGDHGADKSGKGKHKRDSIYNSDGSIWTGYYSN